MTTVLLVAVLVLAFANGANDNSKGVATLVGSRSARPRVALAYATVLTLAGSLTALLLAADLARRFGGLGLLPDAIARDPGLLVAVAAGAGLTVLLATRLGWPVSTTHALVGAFVGGGLATGAGGVDFAALGGLVVLPLVVSPLAAALLAMALYPPLRWLRRRLGVEPETCLCVGSDVVQVVPIGVPAARALAEVYGRFGTTPTCVERYRGQVMGVSAGRIADALHFASAGTLCFARGLNDAPKILGVLLAANVLAPELGLTAIAVAMAAGGLLAAGRVARRMSEDIARMNVGQGLVASSVAALLVIAASPLGLPVSTTHVTCGALFGIGAVNRTAQWRTIAAIGVAWVTTLPAAGVLAAVIALVAR